MKLFPINVSTNQQLIIGGRPAAEAAGHPWLASLRAAIGELGTAWSEHRRRYRELEELAAFSDRELQDLALTRTDVMAISKGTYRRD